jgi:release factor glutamine methyltransferase
MPSFGWLRWRAVRALQRGGVSDAEASVKYVPYLWSFARLPAVLTQVLRVVSVRHLLASALPSASSSASSTRSRERKPAYAHARVFIAMCRRRLRHEPVQFIVGDWDFHCLKGLLVRPPVLIPRPETEELVEMALRHCVSHSLTAPRVLEVGVGSGAVSVALLTSLPRARVTAIDVEPSALKLAAENAQR